MIKNYLKVAWRNVIKNKSHSFINLAGLSVGMACSLLILLWVQNESKEIGIRKVLGASIANIIQLISADFLKLIIIAIIIASPIGWWSMSSWLDGYAYKISISWWMFLIAGLLAIGIALLTVSIQAIKAAVANPVKSLRTE